MGTLADVLSHKGTEVLCIDPNAMVYEAIREMVARNVGSLLVVQDGAPRGIVTERDYLKKVVLRGRSSRTTEVREIMSPTLELAPPNADVDVCLALMTELRIRHLPVVEGKKLVGLVSMGDLMKRKVSEQSVEVEHVESYIQWRH